MAFLKKRLLGIQLFQYHFKQFAFILYYYKAMTILFILFILAYISFTIYAFYNMLINGSLGLFVFNLVGYIILWYLIDKNTRNEEQKVWEKSNIDFEVTHEESSIDDLFYEEPSYTDDSYKEECLIDESIEFDVYLDNSIGRLTEWQNAFFGDYDKRKR